MTFQLENSATEIYEKIMVPLWFGRWAEALLEIASIKPSDRVLDVACGTGVTTRMARNKVAKDGQVVGLDINASMLAQAEKIAAGDDITWLEAKAEETGLSSDSFDLVISQHGYHYFPDKPAALKEFRRVLAPNGRIAFSIWDGHSPYTEAACVAVERYISPEVARKQRSQRETPSADELASQVSNAGFSDVTVHRQELLIEIPLARIFVPQHLGSMPIAGAFQSLSDNEKEKLVAHIEEALSGYVQGERIIYPDAVHVAVGTN